MKSKRLRAFDRSKLKGYIGLIGVDEAGRGALAGPVVAAAVAARADFYETEWCKRNASCINDSKLLTRDQRETLYDKLRWLERGNRLVIGVGRATVEEIENLNILGATQAAMRRAVDDILAKAQIVPHEPDPLFASLEDIAIGKETLAQWRLLVDGKPMKALGYPHEALVQGDSRALCIAMASIVAKVARDRMMCELAREFPHYAWESNKGYPVEAHRSAIVQHGITPHHRRSFGTVHHMLSAESAPQLELAR